MNDVISFINKKARKVRGTYVRAGQTLYAVYNADFNLFWIWAYTDRDFAQTIANRIKPGEASDIAANWRKHTEELTPTARNSD